jgi:hypothetical protein
VLQWSLTDVIKAPINKSEAANLQGKENTIPYFRKVRGLKNV